MCGLFCAIISQQSLHKWRSDKLKEKVEINFVELELGEDIRLFRDAAVCLFPCYALVVAVTITAGGSISETRQILFCIYSVQVCLAFFSLQVHQVHPHHFTLYSDWLVHKCELQQQLFWQMSVLI